MSSPQTDTLLTGLRCLRCGRTFMAGSIDYVCPCRPNRGSDLGHLDAVYDYDAIDAMRNRRPDPADSDEIQSLSITIPIDGTYH